MFWSLSIPRSCILTFDNYWSHPTLSPNHCQSKGAPDEEEKKTDSLDPKAWRSCTGPQPDLERSLPHMISALAFSAPGG